ncbi:MAG: hypothetical protein U0R18_16685 [Mycobacterium sp.]
MSRSAWATDAEIRVNFAEALEAAIQVGQWPPSDQGFDDRTDSALRAVAKAYPDAPKALIDEAHAQLRSQLDGTHARQRRAEMERLFDEQS